MKSKTSNGNKKLRKSFQFCWQTPYFSKQILDKLDALNGLENSQNYSTKMVIPLKVTLKHVVPLFILFILEQMVSPSYDKYAISMRLD